MSKVPIPNLPASIALTGGELLEAVQAGSSVRVTSGQIAALADGSGGGSGYTSIQNQTSPVMLPSPNIEVFFNASGGGFTQTIPALSTYSAFTGKLKFKFWKIDSSVNAINIVLTAPNTFNGPFPNTYSLSVQGESLEIEINFNLSQWMID